MDPFSYLNSTDPSAIEELYNQYLEDPSSVDASWKNFFDGFEFARKNYRDTDEGMEYPSEFKVINLINGYRQRGHLFTETNPVRTRRKYRPKLDLGNFGLSNSDLERTFSAGNELGLGKAKLKEIIAHLKETYCKSVGAEYYYIRKPEINLWLRSKMESSRNSYPFTEDDRKYILRNLTRAVYFEKFIHKKFPGQKRFSLEGAESLIPALDALMEKGAELGVNEFVLGMPHRGRLNVLANILKKSYKDIFSEFEGKSYDDEYLLGDVKYHLGYTNERVTTEGKKVKLTLSPNPSHLEAVDPIVEGIVRARIDRDYKGDFTKIAPILIHGDASIAGQGVVYEVLQFSEIPGYRTGGTIHIVVNNQLGFTTNYLEGRSSTYCTDVAKTVLSPVFHVNGDDVEALVYTIQFAMEFRQKFHKDVFIDLLCYRKYGHNEADEPRFTQPVLYNIIEKHPDPLQVYKKLLESKGIDMKAVAEDYEKRTNALLEEQLEEAKKSESTQISNFLDYIWKDIRKAEDGDFEKSPDTSVKLEQVKKIGLSLSDYPKDVKIFRKLTRLQDTRRKMIAEEGMLDWAMGELLAYGTLLAEKIPVRISGQDSVRGTFSHRHAVLKIEESEEDYTPLNNLGNDQAKFEIYNSPLSEYGVLGFEYGYALANPHSLTIWEAQFGDFFNGAQIIFDQFLSSAEDKWNVMNDLVVFLPHGYEGQGPEHSSARIERFMVLCAENNMQLANCTTPANFFHLLRRQVHREFRKPLVVFTPKSLLRHPKCVSPITDFSKGGFREVLDDESANPDIVTRVVFCSGKVYYDLLEEKEKIKAKNTAIVRLEQLYPLPVRQLEEIIAKYPNVTDWVWTQEEPINMGAWAFMHQYFPEVSLRAVARPPSGSPATGSVEFHNKRQRKIIEKTFGECDCPRVDKECRMICIGNRWRQFNEELKLESNPQ
jgi:2-oxoglutarate dehydrogenase E1 component